MSMEMGQTILPLDLHQPVFLFSPIGIVILLVSYYIPLPDILSVISVAGEVYRLHNHHVTNYLIKTPEPCFDLEPIKH